MPNGIKKPTGSNQDEKLLGAISYLWILSVVMLVIKKDSEFVKFHATQGLVLFIASVIFWFIPVVGWVLNLVVLLVVIIGFIKAISGEKWEIPVIGSLAKKINL